jgi:hypothetical protein
MRGYNVLSSGCRVGCNKTGHSQMMKMGLKHEMEREEKKKGRRSAAKL